MTEAEDLCRKAIQCLYVAVDKHVADDVNAKVKACLKEKDTEIEKLKDERNHIRVKIQREQNLQRFDKGETKESEICTHGGTDLRLQMCKCSDCECVKQCTPMTDFYTKPGDPMGLLFCGRCILKLSEPKDKS